MSAILEIEKNGGRVLYADTDSIFTEFDGKVYSKYSWKIFDEGIFAKPKTYALRKIHKNEVEEEVVIKGIKKNTVNFDLFRKSFLFNIPLSVDSKIYERKNFLIQKSSRMYNINLNNYDKRRFFNDWFESFPY